uniref:Uncharacterized protein n=2 Tax=Oryza sativa subsp. japonica TaxID=39947 RepID=Q6ATU5_ORYSJ|nr:hypothetical protein [Oryza sativa Japonica Group]AAT81666.1 hypothetical protein [Oryza sativa Japonica Group]AAT81694.1 hypothetical protein [Oryza sativa Japonica Group]AAT81700.1 hypothetical protein [Oryza sativa Japonica Group]ABF97622.1 hypothetical protein LOC_Os03g41879 [Oryza sativa Japonica Group]
MAQRLSLRWMRMAGRRRWLKRRRSGACSRTLSAWSRSRRCTAREGFRSKEEMLGIVWRDGNAKEMEVTLTQTEMAKVVVTTTGGKVWGDGEAENLLPRLLQLQSDEWRMATRLGGVESEKRETEIDDTLRPRVGSLNLFLSRLEQWRK